MQTLSANDAKTKFGEMLVKVQREPLQINKNGKPVAIMLSCEDYEQLEQLKLAMLQQRFYAAQTQDSEGALVDGDTFLESLNSGLHD